MHCTGQTAENSGGSPRIRGGGTEGVNPPSPPARGAGGSPPGTCKGCQRASADGEAGHPVHAQPAVAGGSPLCGRTRYDGCVKPTADAVPGPLEHMEADLDAETLIMGEWDGDADVLVAEAYAEDAEAETQTAARRMDVINAEAVADEQLTLCPSVRRTIGRGRKRCASEGARSRSPPGA